MIQGRLRCEEMKSLTNGGRPRRGKPRAQALVEFALILPLLLIVIFAIIEFARLLHAWLAIENGARFGVRYAITGDYDPSNCASGTSDGVNCDLANEVDGARIGSVNDAVRAGAPAILRNDAVSDVTQPGFFNVTVCVEDPPGKYQPPDPDDPYSISRCVPVDDPGDPGDIVSVTVEFNHPLIVPIISSWWPELRLSSRREAIVEQFRKTRSVSLPPGAPTLPPSPTWTSTPTPTNTPTFTPTPTPDCSLIRYGGFWSGGSDRSSLGATIYNGTEYEGHLVFSRLDWATLDSWDSKSGAGVYVDWFRLDGRDFGYGEVEYYGGNDTDSSTTRSNTDVLIPRGTGVDRSAWTIWRADFDYQNSSRWPTYGVDEVGGEMTLTVQVKVNDYLCPPISKARTGKVPTPGPSPTSRPSFPTRTPWPGEPTATESGPPPTPTSSTGGGPGD